MWILLGADDKRFLKILSDFELVVIICESLLIFPGILNVSESLILIDSSPKHNELFSSIGRYFKLLTLVDTLDITGNYLMYIKISSIFSKLFTINLFICKNYYIIIHN